MSAQDVEDGGIALLTHVVHALAVALSISAAKLDRACDNKVSQPTVGLLATGLATDASVGDAVVGTEIGAATGVNCGEGDGWAVDTGAAVGT